MATDRLTLQMLEDGGVEPLSDVARACASGTTPHRRTAAVKLAAKIFTALAIALAISYVAARDYTPDASAAAGKIDVLNVGTCYATSSEVFGEDDCRDNLTDNDQYNLAEEGASGGAGIRDLKTGSKIYSTYAVDPKTSAEEPRAILLDSDLIKVSIEDEGRDRRTPVLLKAGGASAPHLTTGGANPVTTDCYGTNNALREAPTLSDSGTVTGLHRELCAVYELVNNEFFQNSKKDDLLDFDLHQRFEARGTNPNVEYTSSRASNNIVDVSIPSGAPNTEDFQPLHFKLEANGEDVHSDTIIRWYGYLIHATAGTEKSGCETVTAATANDVSTLTETPEICDLSGWIGLDEDIGSGRTRGENPDDATSHIAPYITFNVSLPSAYTVRVRYIYYETSEKEDIIGGAKRSARTATADVDDYDSTNPDASAPVFTNDESGAQPDALVVEAVGDGVERSSNLWLKETGRFTGRYEGYLRLTDANGDAVQTTANQSEPNWGREVGDATDETFANAAVLGVQGGPVNIRYRDSDGNVQTTEIAVDTQPPLINIETPEYKANFDDQRVLVTGSFTDADSGLRDDSFRLYLDNLDDSEEDGENNSDQTVLKLRVDGRDTEDGDGKSAGYVTLAANTDVVQLAEDYVGYGDDDGIDGDSPTSGLFGVLRADWLYKSLTQMTSGGDTYDALKTIDPDSYADGASEAVFNDIARLDLVDNTGDPVDDLNNQIDFQALVLDIAGNVGFSDSDPAGPTFIHDYGTKQSDRKAGRYNVLGWYARHIISIDQVDPRLGRVVTGFYGENDDDEPQPNVRGLMLMFDGAIDASSVDNGTFVVELDSVGGADPVNAVVVDVSVEGDMVYLLLDSDLLPDATPKLSVASGRSVRDPAGNQLSSNDELNNDDGNESREIESIDGIPPTFAVSLSRGSGTGQGDEGPGRLTNESIVVRITSNEGIQGAPHVVFVCKDFTWNDPGTDADSTSDDVTRDLQDVISNRSGKKTTANASEFAPAATVEGNCDDDNTADLSLRYIGTYSRPGNAWEYQWRNDPNENDQSLARLPDGDVTVVAFGRDTSDWYDDYKPGTATEGMQSYNWGAATAEFELDSVLRPPTDTGFGSVQPGADGVVFESRPFVLLTFRDASTVSISSFKIDGTAQEITALGNNRFLYWPESLSFGKHKVEIDSVDAAANERSFSYEFEVKQRTAFNVELLAGWNAVSVPAMPVNPTIGDVFTIDEVDQVVSWDSATPAAPWRIATKVDGVWSTNAEFAPLNTIEAGKGYWVHANGFVDQSVMLTGIPDRESAANAPAGPIGIATVKGWNFVGVVDTDGDQTQDGDFGEELMNSKDEMVTATVYLRTYKQAYTWDPIKLQFNVVEGGDNIEIGDGIWVYYADGFNLAP